MEGIRELTQLNSIEGIRELTQLKPIEGIRELTQLNSTSLSAHARRRHVEVSRSLILCIYPVLQCFNSVESYMYVYVALL